MPLRRVAQLSLHLLLTVSLVVSGGMWPVAKVASAATTTVAAGMPCHGEARAAPVAQSCDNGCCPQSGCDPSACIATACPPQILIVPGVVPPVRLQAGWYAPALPSRLIDTPLRPPIGML